MSELVIRSSVPPSLSEHLSPGRLVRSIWGNRELIGNFARRELMERHKGALLGVAWNIVSPLLTLAVYTIVFGYIFGTRWGRGSPPLPDRFDFPLTFFAGNALFHVFTECANRAPTLVTSRSNLVRKVVFPLEILPVTAVWAAFIQSLITIGLLLAVLAIVTDGAGLHWQILYLPLVMLPLLMLSVGAAWALSAVGVFIRDLRHVVVVLTQLLMFMTPVFYKLDARLAGIHPWLRGIIAHNPLSVIVENGRRVMLWGETPDWIALGWVTMLGAAAMFGGNFVFSAMRRSMADVH
jgi:lipopolysaccharide transport system permease protein